MGPWRPNPSMVCHRSTRLVDGRLSGCFSCSATRWRRFRPPPTDFDITQPLPTVEKGVPSYAAACLMGAGDWLGRIGAERHPEAR